MLAIIGASGKIGYATLTALLEHKLISPAEVIACTSSAPSSPMWNKLASLGVEVRRADFNDPDTLRTGFTGADSLYLVSTPRIELDYNDAPPGTGREANHFAAIDAARSVGVQHIYYTSLAFGRPSPAGVMRAHIRTEQYLESLKDVKWTIIREGLYNESWPLYLGYFDVSNDAREEVVVAGDGLINWTSIANLGVGSALILTAPKHQYAGKTLYLSTAKNVISIRDLADLVGRARGKQLTLDVVSRHEHVDFYVNKQGMDAADVEWWVSSYDAISQGETHIHDNLLDHLLASVNVSPDSIEDTISGMMSSR